MVKKLRCDVVPSDWVRIVKYAEDIAVQVNIGEKTEDIFLTPSDAKKLRKQIKKALIEIEGEPRGDIRPIQNWKPKEGEKVLIVDSTYTPNAESNGMVGKFGEVSWCGVDIAEVYTDDALEDFHISDLRPAE